jgi:hypothetical protein
MTIMFRAIATAGVLLLFATPPARAQSHDVKGSKDHPLNFAIPRFSHHVVRPKGIRGI